jgi:predicted RNA binding protein YcfA (HicA-like mRNA interferase family)
MATKKIKINFKMPTPTAAERLHAQQQKNRKAAGLPDPSEYKKKLDSMKSEEVEPLDEISPQLKASYVAGAKKQIKQSMPFTKKSDEYRDIAKNFIAKRQKGIAKANEEVELLDEMPESNMKVRDVHSHLKKAGWALARSKGGHDVYKHPKAKHSIPVPRHNQLKAPLIRGIMKASKVEEQLEKKGRFVSGPMKQPFKSNTILTSVKEATDEREYDYEGDMAKSDLRSIIHNAQTLHDMLDDNTNLAEWCQSKITLAEDYISTVTNYMRSEMNEEVEQIDELSKGTLGSYIKKARFSGEHHNWRANVARAKQDQNISMKKHDNRIKGIDKAVDRLTKEEVVQEDKNDYQRKIEKNNKNFIAASKRQKNPLTNVHTAQTKQKPMKEDVELDEQGLHSARDLHLSKDDYLRKYTPKKSQDDAKKKQPQGADFAAQRRKERLAKSGRMDEKKNLPGLWANIHAKRKRGESPAKPGDKDYPKTLNIESAAEPTEGEMKGKQQMSRRAQIVKDAVKGKKSDSPDKFQKDPELSSEIHKT